MRGEKTTTVSWANPDSGPSTLLTAPRRQASVYDAVAGRVTTRRIRGQGPSTLLPEVRQPSGSVIVTPEEALFRRLNAPIRYAENDFYFANENLPSDKPLPDSDMLKALHTYASDFYRAATVDQGQTDWQSMDETALIALGILLEETANESLGETGDMVFVEGQEVSETDEASTHSGARSRSRKRANTASSAEPESVLQPRKKSRKRRHKSRKYVEQSDLTSD